MDENSIRMVLQSFSSFMQLPVFWIQLNNNKIITNAEYETLAVTLKQSDLYRQLEEVALAIEQPAIVTSYDEKTWVGAKLAIAPLITCGEEVFFLAAGPYQEKTTETQQNGILPIADSRHIIQQFTANGLLAKEIANYVRHYEEKLYNQFVSLLTEVSTEDESFIRVAAERLVQMNLVDFFGQAVKCADGSFTVQFLVGERSESNISGQSFYIGEGLLGQVALQHTFLQWDEAGLESRAGYFHQFGFFPASLAVYPVDCNGELTDILFAGFYDKRKLPSYMSWLFQRLQEHRQRSSQDKERVLYKKLLQALLDWTDRISYTKHPSDIVEQFLDICFKMTGGHACIYTNTAGQQKKRGTISPQLLQVHLQEEMDKKVRFDAINSCIHQPIVMEEEQGVLTIICHEPQFARVYIDVLQIMTRFLVCSNNFSIDDASSIEEHMACMEDVIMDLPLTSREKEILSLVLDGMNNTEVSRQLNISSHTVKNHITNIFKKLNVTDRMQAMVKIYRIKYKDD